MDTMISMNIIRRAGVFIAAAVVVPVVALTASGCGGATPADGGATPADGGATPANGGATTAAVGATNGLETKTSAQVVRDAAAALGAAKSVQIVMTAPRGKGGPSQMDLQIQGGSKTLTIVNNGIAKAKFTIIGQYAYVKINPAVLKMLGGLPMANSLFGRWLKIPVKQLNLGGPAGFSLPSLAAVMTRHSPDDSAVQQATLNGRKVVVITDHGLKLYVANTGPAYLLRLDFMGPNPQRFDFTDYGANFHITTPRNAIPAR